MKGSEPTVKYRYTSAFSMTSASTAPNSAPKICGPAAKNAIATTSMSDTVTSASWAALLPALSPVQAEPKKPDVAAKLTADNGSEHPINTCEFRIGSGVGVGLTVNDPKVSRNHAVIEFENGEYYIRDLYSANGTFVNEKRLAANSRTKIADGDTVAFADETFTFCIG